MLSESDKRAALLAVSRYGADPSRVYEGVRAVLEMRSQGNSVDLLDFFQREKLLTAVQTLELRSGLEKTLAAHLSKNGSPPPSVAPKGSLLPTVADLASEEPAIAEEGPPLDLRFVSEYRVLRRLGEGGTGAVFLAYHEKENRQVAIKVLAKRLAKKQDALDRFYREAKSGTVLTHPNIVRTLGVGCDRQTGLHYLVLEYIDGPSALDLLDQYQRLPIGDAVHVILDIARALEYAHSRNFVHRDIKPANILMTLSGLAKLSDMGLAKSLDETSHLTHARQGFGTPFYMPHEQSVNAKDADARSDIYALGATFYHLIVGEVPFGGTTASEILDKKKLGHFTPASKRNPDVPRALDDILAKMLARAPRDRYQSVSELIVDLERSHLASALPSFTDPDNAMRDPVVRQRLSTPVATTWPDLDPLIVSPSSPGRSHPVAAPAESQGRPIHFAWWIALGSAIGIVILLVAIFTL